MVFLRSFINLLDMDLTILLKRKWYRILPFIFLVVVLYFALVEPYWFYQWRLDKLGSSLMEKESGIRILFAQILGGAAVLIGAILAWLKMEISQEGQITDRFSRAIDHLGADSLKIRLGGIYGLERIAKDSPYKDYWNIVEILTAYLRDNCPTKEEDRIRLNPPSYEEAVSARIHAKHPVDIKAIINVLKRRKYYYGNGEIELISLDSVDLHTLDFENIHLEHVDFAHSVLDWTTFTDAYLTQAQFPWCSLVQAGFCDADLRGANFYQADLRGAELGGADVSQASFVGAHLDYIDFTEVKGLTLKQIEQARSKTEIILPKYLLENQ